MEPEVIIRSFAEGDGPDVRDLFIRVNRMLAPPHLEGAFEDYIARSLREEIERIADYYGERRGGFWVAAMADRVVGMFGLEPAPGDAMELRRMYVDPSVRGRGIARKMLRFAEQECRRRQAAKLELSTSELQVAALALYRKAGFRLLREAVAETASNKTLGGGLRRFYFEKVL